MQTATRRAIGIVRVSQTNGREGESFASATEQRDRIRAACERDGLKLLDTIDELDVSGGTPLADRAGLRAAVEAVESGTANVIVAAYFDRLVRSLTVQAEVVERVERAGGQLLAVDFGQVTNGSAAQWVSGTMLGMMAEYQRRSVKERSGAAQARAVARGIPPWPNVTPGYVRAEADDPLREIVKGQFVPDSRKAKVVLDAFRMRADGATVADVRTFLAAHGIVLSYHGVTTLLKSRVVLGEIHFGDLVNLSAHPAIVDVDTWKRVQRTRVSRGRRAKSDRLLARLDVLRCASCGARMVVGTAHHGQYWLYRCPPTGDCERRVTISAELVEGIVSDHVRAALADVEGRASVEDHGREAAAELERAQGDLDAAIQGFATAGVRDESSAVERIAALREVRDRAQEQVDHLGGSLRPAITINADRDWDRLSLDARRALIRAVVAQATVAPGRGAERVTVELVSE